jgi:hypothetical protein
MPGLAKAVEVLEGAAPESTRLVLLLTDGVDTYLSGGFEAKLGAARHWIEQLGKVGAGLYVLGLGADHDAELLRAVSELSRYPYVYLREPSEIPETFERILGLSERLVARTLAVHVLLARGVPLPRLLTPFLTCLGSDREEASVTLWIHVPDLAVGEQRHFLLEWTEPLLEAELGQVRLRYVRPGVPEPIWTQTCSLRAPSAPAEAEAAGAAVASQLTRVQMAEALSQAASASAAGQATQAVELLREAETQVQASARRYGTPDASTLSDLTATLTEATAALGRFQTSRDATHTLAGLANAQQLERNVSTPARFPRPPPGR